ncbi:MAG: flagellar protein FlaG [Calditrichia bacterium]
MDVYSLKSATSSGAGIPPGIESGKVESASKSEAEEAIRLELKQNSSKKSGQMATDFSQMMKIAREVSEKLRHAGVNIEFEIGKASHKIVIVVKDPHSGEIIRRIPPESFMKTVEHFSEMQRTLSMQGIEVDVKY